jgi:hypothetical protein
VLDVAAHSQEVCVALHGKRLETSLIQVPGADAGMMGVPTLGMGNLTRDLLAAASSSVGWLLLQFLVDVDDFQLLAASDG